MVASTFYAFAYEANVVFFAAMGLSLQDVGRGPGEILTPSSAVVVMLLAVFTSMGLVMRDTWLTIAEVHRRTSAWVVVLLPPAAVAVTVVRLSGALSDTSDPRPALRRALGTLVPDSGAVQLTLGVIAVAWVGYLVHLALRDSCQGLVPELPWHSWLPSGRAAGSLAAAVLTLCAMATALEVTERASDAAQTTLATGRPDRSGDLEQHLAWLVVRPDLTPVTVRPTGDDPLGLCAASVTSTRLLELGRSDGQLVVVQLPAAGRGRAVAIPLDQYLWQPARPGSAAAGSSCF